MSTLARVAPWFAAEIVRKSGGAVTREGVMVAEYVGRQ